MLTLPGDVGGLDLPKDTGVPRFVSGRDRTAVPDDDGAPQRRRRDQRRRAGHAARRARVRGTPATRCWRSRAGSNAPMVLTLKAKEGFDDDNPYEVGQSGLIGNHATAIAFEGCDALVMIGTDFPYRNFLPTGKTVVQLDVRGTHIGRRTPVTHRARR